MSFWNEPTEEKSYSLLLQLKRKWDFVLIGGWAVFLYTKASKSKDIDMVVGYDELSRMMVFLPIKKNDRLRKYEADIKGVSVDVYLSHYSNLIIPPEDLIKESRIIEGFRVPRLEMLLALKQQAEMERKGSIKGMKDRVDILSILLTDLDMGEYVKLVEPGYLKRLREIVAQARDEFRYLGIMDLRDVRKKREKLLKKVTSSPP